MRIGVDARCLLRVAPRGEGQTLLRLYGEIARRHPSVEIVLFSDTVRPESVALAEAIPRARIAALDLPGWRWRSWQRLGLPWLALRHRVDLLHGFSTIVSPAFGLPIALTVHDLIPALALPNDSPMRRRYLRRLDRSVRAARVVLCPSASTRDDLVRLGVPLRGREVRVVPWGPTLDPSSMDAMRAAPRQPGPAREASAARDAAAARERIGAAAGELAAMAAQQPLAALAPVAPTGGAIADVPLAERPVDAGERACAGVAPTVIAFAASDPRKNIDRLIDGFAVSATRAAGGRLVLLGADSPATLARFEKRSAAAGLSDAVTVHGFLPAAQRDALLRQAQLLVYPSLYEGFGLPVLDAMSVGVPVAASDRSSIPEVGGDAIEYFDPLDALSIAAAIDRVALRPRRAAQMREHGLRRARLFCWARCADEHMSAFRRILD